MNLSPGLPDAYCILSILNSSSMVIRKRIKLTEIGLTEILGDKP